MNNKTLGIYGAGGLGREVLELARVINAKHKRWNEIAFVVDSVISKTVNGVEVYEYEEAIKKFEELEVIVAIGEPVVREKKYIQLETDGVSIPTLIHPDVYIPDTTEIGKGVVIQYGCFISCNVSIGNYVFIQPQCNIGHDDILEKGCMLSGFTNLGGNTTIGSYTYVGLSSSIKEKVSIGNYCIVGMGSAVVKNIEDEMITLGNPARIIARNSDKKVFK